MGARHWQGVSWLILLGVIGCAVVQGDDFSTTVPESVAFGCALGLAVACAYLGLDEEGGAPAKAKQT